MNTALQDLRYGFRLARQAPGFTAAAVLTLALGMCAATTIFSVVYGVALRPLPYRDPDRLVSIWTRALKLNLSRAFVGAANYHDWREQNRSLEDIALVRVVSNFNLTGDGEPERLLGGRSTANLFSILGVQPQIGRTFTKENEQPGAIRVVLLSHSLWMRRFGGEPGVVGRTIHLNGEPHTVLGVMPPDFRYPSRNYDLWLPLYLPPEAIQSRADFDNLAVARLKPGVSLAQAQSDLDAVSGNLEREYPANAGISARIAPLLDDTVREVRTALYVLLAAVGCLLLIGCVNVASLFLARGLSRARERAVRAALGAPAARLAIQSVMEVIPVVAMGAALGVLLAAWSVRGLVALLPATLPRVDEVRLSLPVLVFSGILLAFTSLVVAFWPALQSAAALPGDALRQETRGGSGGRAQLAVREFLVVVEIALTVMLVAGACLMIRSFSELKKVPLGYDGRHVLAMQLAIPRAKYGKDTDVADFISRLMERVRAVPGVKAAGLVNRLPLAGINQIGSIEFDGENLPLTGVGNAEWRTVTPDYFRAMGIPLIAGRFFTESDRAGGSIVGLIDDRTARQVWPNESPIGKRFRIRFAGSPWVEIVGVVGRIRHDGADAEPRTQVYWSYRQRTQDRMALAVRTDGDPAKWAASVISTIRAVDPDQPVYAVAPMEEMADRSLAQHRLDMGLVSVFAMVALLLAGVGIYGVTAYAVERRAREFGIRMALGAHPAQLVRLVLLRTSAISGLGAVAGLAAAGLLSRFVGTMLFQVSPTDWLSYCAAAGMLVGVALAAGYIPSRRSANLDPLQSLRAD